MDLALNNMKKLICYKTKPTNQTAQNVTIIRQEKNYFSDQIVSVKMYRSESVKKKKEKKKRGEVRGRSIEEQKNQIK